jgi:ribulose-phosphate 3-epimerase
LRDVHLLIDMPEKQIENFIKASSEILTFSAEYCSNIEQTLKSIKQMPEAKELLIGLSLNPSTSIETIAPFINEINVVVLLAIGPDTGANNYISQLPGRISTVKELNKDILIFVDGAIKKDNIAEVASMCPDVIVAGSAIFDGKDAAGNLTFMLNAIKG